MRQLCGDRSSVMKPSTPLWKSNMISLKKKRMRTGRARTFHLIYGMTLKEKALRYARLSLFKKVLLWEDTQFSIRRTYFVDGNNIGCCTHVRNLRIALPFVHDLSCGCYHGFFQT